jgi:hypothetical protein
MDQGGFEEEVLGFVCDDYEAPSTITKDMSRELRRAITESEVRTALLSLAEKGMVKTFAVDAAKGRLVPVTLDVARLEADPWFIAKPEFGGRAGK